MSLGVIGFFWGVMVTTKASFGMYTCVGSWVSSDMYVAISKVKLIRER